MVTGMQGMHILPVGTEAGLLEVTHWATDGSCVLGAARSFVTTEAARNKLWKDSVPGEVLRR